MEEQQSVEQPILTKKQRREMKRQEKMLAVGAQAKKEKTGRFLLWFFVFAGVVAVIYGMVALVSRGNDGGTPVPLANELTTEDWQTGPAEAPLTLIEYSDFQCPACGFYYSVLKQLKQDFSGKLRFAYRHFPLSSIHPYAELAARASEAAGSQGKFWEMHDKLFENQSAWSQGGDLKETFSGYAKDLGLDISRFREDLDAKEMKNSVQSDYRSGLQDGINSTPSFYLNGARLNNSDIRNYEAFRTLLQTALDNAS